MSTAFLVSATRVSIGELLAVLDELAVLGELNVLDELGILNVLDGLNVFEELLPDLDAMSFTFFEMDIMDGMDTT